MYGRFFRDPGGNVMIMAGLLFPVLLMAAGASVDYASMSNQSSDLQAAADAAVLATAREAPVHGWDQAKLTQIAGEFLAANISSSKSAGLRYRKRVVVDKNAGSISMDVAADPVVFVMQHIKNGKMQIGVNATALAFGEANICIHSLDARRAGALSLSDASSVSGRDCAVLSNSTSQGGIKARSGSSLDVEVICSAGGYSGGNDAFTPVPTTDCPANPDPMNNRSVQPGGSCDETDLRVEGGSVVLSPGVYCGDTEFYGGAEVTLSSGLYVFTGGELQVLENSKVVGDNVTLQFKGSKSGFHFKNESALSLSAPTDGPTAGMLIQADTLGKDKRPFKILSRNADRMIGVIYIPSGTLVIGGDGDRDGICDDAPPGRRWHKDHWHVEKGGDKNATCTAELGKTSDWTSIVANEIAFTKGAKVQLNTDYDTSNIPMPSGLGGNVRLVR